MRWQLVEADSISVNRDEAFVTRLDPVTDFPVSSSSQPSVMAFQLSELDLHAGQRVLEIGNGTGYNAALLAELVGPAGQVTTIDIDAQLVQSARASLAALHLERVGVHCSNGFAGFMPLAPCDRIIATGSFYALPPAWLDQLAMGGVLVGNLASVFLRLSKVGEDMAAGTFLPIEDKRYMLLHHGKLPHHRFPKETWYEHVPCRTYATDLDIEQLLHSPAFLFFLQCEHPDFQRYWRTFRGLNPAPAVCLTTKEQTSVLMVQKSAAADTWTVSEYGSATIWQEIQECYQRWEQVGKPGITRYTLAWRQSEQDVVLPGSPYRWRIPGEK